MPLDGRMGRRLRADEDRAYPANAEIEQSLLGPLRCAPAAPADVRDQLRREHFGHEINGRLYDGIRHLVDRGVSPSPATLMGYFDGDPSLTQSGGVDYIIRLAQCAVSLINAPGYAATLIELAQRRELMFAAEELHERAAKLSLDDPVSGQIEHFGEALSRIEQESAFRENRSKPYRSLGEVTDEALERAQRAYQNKGQL